MGGGTSSYCEAGYMRVVCYTNADLNERFIVHEFGHVLQNTIDGVNARQTPPTPSVGPYYDLEEAQLVDKKGDWITGTHPGGVFERTMLGYTNDGIPDVYHGRREWDDWNTNVNHTARNEYFADMFMNWVFNSFEYNDPYSDAGQIRYDWMQAHMQNWIDLARRDN